MNTSIAYLIHVPKKKDYFYPFKIVSYINYMSYGLIPIAAYATDSGYPTKIIHLGLEELLNSDYDIEQDIIKEHPKIIGLSLHWHYSSYDVIELAKKIKNYNEEIIIVLGGYTASFFATEIMEQFKFIDFIIRGEGEIPWFMLLKALDNKINLSCVPNLAWRKNGQIILNKGSYSADENQLNSFDFTRFSLVKHYEYLPKLYWYFPLGKAKFNRILLNRNIGNDFYFPVARGCSNNCLHCGGSKKATQIISGRDKLSLFSPKRLVYYVKEASKLGFTSAYILLDSSLSKSYLEELFNEFLVSKIKLKMAFEFYGIPENWHIEKIAKVFNRNCGVIINLVTGNESYRKQFGKPFFSNEDFFDVLSNLKTYKLNTNIMLYNDLPNETESMKKETRTLIKKIRRIHKNAVLLSETVDLDPGSLLYLFPEKFGIIRTRSTFMDYYMAHSKIKIDRGYMPNENKKFLKKEQSSILHTSLLAITINFLMFLPIAHIFLKLFLIIRSRKSSKRIFTI